MEVIRYQAPNPKQKRIQDELKGYWSQDIWLFAQCPLTPEDLQGRKGQRIAPDKAITFHCQNLTIKAELKYACWQKIEGGEWLPRSMWIQAQEIHSIVQWLDTKAASAQSLLDKDLRQWELSLRSYLAETGKLRDSTIKVFGRTGEKTYFHESPQVTKFRQIYKKVEAFYAEPASEYDKDVWDVRNLGVFVNPSTSAYRLNFTKFNVPWMQRAAKQFIKYSLSICSVNECQKCISKLLRFTQFLTKTNPNVKPEEIDRPLLLEYVSKLSESELAANTRARHISQIRTFLELCAREGWANVPNKRLIYQEDFPKGTRALPRFIPEEVMEQLNEHLDEMETLYARMLLVLQECGMRVGELCKLAFNCLLQDAHGDWFLRYYRFKLKKEHSIPITREVAAIIQQQQKEVVEVWGTDFPYLFPAPKPRGRGGPLKQQRFTRTLNRFARKKGIKDRTGQNWHFQAHQFRHTVGTRMVNNNVPHHIIQRFLGHESPEMTARYAYIHDETLKKEFEKFMGSKVVNVEGKAVKVVNVKEQAVKVDPQQPDNADLQWFKKHVLAQALPNGTCALPTLMGPCPHANACLTCTHFRTDARFLAAHEKQLEQAEELLQVAQANGWTRQIETNERVRDNLVKMIASLKEESHEDRA